MHCEFVVPGLLSCASANRFPALELLLARGRRRAGEASRLETWLRQAFAVETDTLAAGAITCLAAGADPGAEFWLRADPVHMRLMRDRLLLLPGEALSLSAGEAAALCDALNRHFAGVMEVRALDPRRWYARFTRKEPVLDDIPALELAGREIPLKGSFTEMAEIEMLLHAHPVNEAREARGEPPVNYLWLWGGGRAPKARSPWSAVLADEPLAQGLARLARAGCRALPRAADEWLGQAAPEGRTLVVLDALRAPAALEERHAFEKNLNDLEQAWFAPLLAALRAGRVGMVTLHVPDGATMISCETVGGDLRRFWRRARPLGVYA